MEKENEAQMRQCLRDLGVYLEKRGAQDPLIGEDFFSRYSRELVRESLVYEFQKLREAMTGSITVETSLDSKNEK